MTDLLKHHKDLAKAAEDCWQDIYDCIHDVIQSNCSPEAKYKLLSRYAVDVTRYNKTINRTFGSLSELQEKLRTDRRNDITR